MSITVLNKNNFEDEVIRSDKPVLVDFWAAWCGPCRMLSPVVDEIAEEEDTVKVAKLNIDEEPEIASRYGVMSIPTLILFEGGNASATSVGVRPKSDILRMIGK